MVSSMGSHIALVLVSIAHLASLGLSSTCHPPLVVMGASLVDVGENAEAMPLRSSSEFVPYGVHYFGKPAARFSNGRVISDFVSQGLGYGLLSPYLNSVEPDFTHGVNFASSGSTARNTTVTGNGTSSSGLFSLSVQVDQYAAFLAKVAQAEMKNNGSVSRLPSSKHLSVALYLLAPAHNDYINTISLAGFNAQAEVNTTITAIEKELRKLYALGARNIIVMNVFPLGCTPGFVSGTEVAGVSVDKDGCLASANDVADLHNSQLLELLSRLREELSLKHLVILDANAIYLDAIRNSSKYGVTHPFVACCGAGGKYNVVPSIGCGQTGLINGTLTTAKSCIDPTQYISWDGLHPVESFAKFIGEGVLTGEYLKPHFNISHSCTAT